MTVQNIPSQRIIKAEKSIEQTTINNGEKRRKCSLKMFKIDVYEMY